MYTKLDILNYFKWENLAKRYEFLDKHFECDFGDTIIDCGAQYGDISFYFHTKVGESGMVYAIEPCESVFQCLCESVRYLDIKNVVPLRIALSNKEKIERLYHSDRSKAAYSIVSGFDTQNNEFERVPAMTLDKIVKTHNIKQIDGVYMNIEGSEYICIDGMKETLEKFKPFILICDHIKSMPLGEYKDLRSILNSFGYEIIYDGIKSGVDNKVIAK